MNDGGGGNDEVEEYDETPESKGEEVANEDFA